jgi:hypothetical protein
VSDPDHERDEPTPPEEDDLGELDAVDPLKREGEDELPGLDPIVPPVPPES